jgi:N-acetylmuramoyl-L-alanine amidase
MSALLLVACVSPLAFSNRSAHADDIHLVAGGESLSTIARLYGVALESLALANAIANPDYIQSGQRLRIPSSSAVATGPVASATHYVSPGESLSWIAAQYEVSISQLMAANAIGNADYIQAGQALSIPGVFSGLPVVTTNNVPRLSRDEAGWILYQAEVEFGLPSGIFRALAWQESGWQTWVVSSAGARGLAQVMPETGDWVVENLLWDAADWRTNPTNNARVGAAFFRYLLGLTGWDVELALAGYYQGLGNVARYGMYTDTRQYIANVLYFRNWYS